MAMMTPRAAAAVAAALHTAQAPALRAYASRGGAPNATDYGGSPATVETTLAWRRGPGEVAVTCGAAIVYLPAALLEAYPDIVLDLQHEPGRPERDYRTRPPSLRLRPPTGPDHTPSSRPPP